MRILIADDHEEVRAQIRCALEAEHWYVCGEAENGQEALDKVQQLRPDLIIRHEYAGTERLRGCGTNPRNPSVNEGSNLDHPRSRKPSLDTERN